MQNILLILMLLVASSCTVQADKQVPSTGKATPGLTESFAKLHGQAVNVNFNNASLQTISNEISSLFNVTFIYDDSIKKGDGTPLGQGLGDHKVTFNTNRTLGAMEAMNLFKTFLELAGFSMIATYDPYVYRITAIAQANKSPLPTYINAPIDSLPDNDTRVRYVLLIINNSPSEVYNVLNKLKSQTGSIQPFENLNALIITDKSYNVRGLVEIAKQLDTGNMPETMSVMRLKDADAAEVAKTIENLKQKEPKSGFRVEKTQTVSYFPQDVKFVPSRNNTLIIMGPKEGVRRVESFITEHIDKKLRTDRNLLHVHPLNYALAESVADILNEVVKFGKSSDPSKVSGVQYFSNVFIQAEKQNNTLIIKGTPEDVAMLEPVIESLDVQQPQVAIEVLIVSLNLDKNRQFGSQMRSRSDRTLNWQTSGFMNNPLSKPVIDKATGSLLGNLLELVEKLNSSLTGATLVSLGKTSVWALFGILQENTQTRVLSNPFLVSTNKYKATVSLGQTRNVATQTITDGGGTGDATTGFTPITAELKVTMVPQINEYGIINLNIEILIEDFTESLASGNQNSASFGNKDIKNVKTTANVADGEVLALGGLIRSRAKSNIVGTPILKRIPLIGRAFENQDDENHKENLVIFIAPKIIQSNSVTGNIYTNNKSEYAQRQFGAFERDDQQLQPKDPIRKWFFDPARNDQTETFLEFMHANPEKDKEIQVEQQVLEEKIKNLEEKDHSIKKVIEEETGKKKGSPLLNVVKKGQA